MAAQTILAALNGANPNDLDKAMGRINLGDMLTPVEVTISQGAATTVVLADSAAQPAMLVPLSVRVTGGAAAAGGRNVVDAAATPSATDVALSADGLTLTFEANVTDVVVRYLRRPAVALTEALAIQP